MKNSLLALMFLLSCQTLAAVHISHDGKAEAIIVPYYTVANGLTTLLTIDNTTDEFKAIKIHLLEARNGDAIYSFNLYLTPKDMWAAAITDVNGMVNIVSNDESCTYNLQNLTGPPPQLPEGGWEWQTGMLEIIEMGVVDTSQLTDMDDANRCQVLNDAWEAQGPNSLWRADGTNAMLPVTGGLQTNTSVIDVSSGFSFEVPVIHLDNFYPENTIDNRPPESEFPNLSSGDTTSLLIHDGQAITTQWPTGYEAVSALLVKTTLENEYDVKAEVAGTTEWVISFPTLKYHKSNLDSQKPFIFENTDLFRFPGTPSNDYRFFDRSGTVMSGIWGCILPPPGVYCPPINFLNHTVTTYVIAPDEEESIASTVSGGPSDAVRILNTVGSGFPENTFISGKVSLEIKSNNNDNQFRQVYAVANDRGTDYHTQQTHLYYGLPVLGFAFQSYKNANAQPNRLATYATTKPHAGNLFIETENAENP